MYTIISPYLDREALELEVLDEANESSTKQLNSPFLIHEFLVEEDLNESEHFDEDWSEGKLEDEWDESQDIEDEGVFYEAEESSFEKEEFDYNLKKNELFFEDEYDDTLQDELTDYDDYSKTAYDDIDNEFLEEEFINEQVVDEYYDDYEEIEGNSNEDEELRNEEVDFIEYKYDSEFEEIEDEFSFSWKGIVDKAKHARDLIIQMNTARDAILKGGRDENKITDVVFYVLYPSKKGKKLKRRGPFVKKWLAIRKNTVRPLLGIIENNQKPLSRDDLNSLRDAISDVTTSVESLYKIQDRAITSVNQEITEKDPAKGSMMDDIFVQLGMMALNIATAGIASKVTLVIKNEVFREMTKQLITGTKDIIAQTAFIKKNDFENNTSKSPRIAFFDSQHLYLINILADNKFLAKVKETTGDKFMSTYDIVAELKRVKQAIDSVANIAFKFQKEATTAQWCTLLATSDLGVINDREGRSKETNLQKAVNSIARWPVTIAVKQRDEYDGVLYLFLKPWSSDNFNDFWDKASYDLNSSTRFQLYAARIDGVNSLLIKTIEGMDLLEMRIPMVVTLRLHSSSSYFSTLGATNIEEFRMMTFASFGRNERGSMFIEKRKTDGNTLDQLSKSIKNLNKLSGYNHSPHTNELDAIEVAKKTASDILEKTIGSGRKTLKSLNVKLKDW